MMSPRVMTATARFSTICRRDCNYAAICNNNCKDFTSRDSNLGGSVNCESYCDGTASCKGSWILRAATSNCNDSMHCIMLITLMPQYCIINHDGTT